MSIDARVQTVIVNEDGSGELRLIDRPGGGIAGQRTLWFESAPEEVTALNGCDIWGGSNSILLGEVEIAERVGYTQINFYKDEIFKEAIRRHRK